MIGPQNDRSTIQKTLMVAYIWLFSPTGFAQTPHFIGRTSCSTATCHGGLIGDGPVWHSSASRWESSDPHRAAGDALLTDMSRRIVTGLELASTQDSALFIKVLKDRCVSCHAPESIPSNEDDIATFRQQLSRGVGCESCHGPASTWEKLHTRTNWSDMNRFDTSVGMRETTALLARVDNCARCHVGSRTLDNSVRDMNHDVIAAGHPALVFDMYHYENALPEHWDISKSAFNASSSTMLVRRAAAARARVLFAAANLSAERTAAASQVPQPELSEFDCTACHHELSSSSQSSNSFAIGFPSWNSWLTIGTSFNFATDKMRLDSLDMPRRVAIIRSESERRSLLEQSVKEPDPLAFFKSSLKSTLKDPRLRSQIVRDGAHARAWLDQMEIAAHAAALQLTESSNNKVNELLHSFRVEKLGETPGQTFSQRILESANCDAADVEKLCTETIRAMTSLSRER